jgi:hypothetical protein
VLSILKPEAVIDPAIKKRIGRFYFLLIPCTICGALLLFAQFVMNSPPRWTLTAAQQRSIH